jgi:hypothetical protein
MDASVRKVFFSPRHVVVFAMIAVMHPTVKGSSFSEVTYKTDQPYINGGCIVHFLSQVQQSLDWALAGIHEFNWDG